MGKSDGIGLAVVRVDNEVIGAGFVPFGAGGTCQHGHARRDRELDEFHNDVSPKQSLWGQLIESFELHKRVWINIDSNPHTV